MNRCVNFVKIVVVCFSLGMLALLIAYEGVLANSSDRTPDGATGGPVTEINCSFCHSSRSSLPSPDHNTCIACHDSFRINSGGGELRLEGVPETYIPGQRYMLSVHLMQPGAMRRGFELTAMDEAGNMVGQFAVTDPARTSLSDNAGTIPDYVKHTAAGMDTGTPDQAPGWNVDWIAPSGSPETVTFYAAGVAADNASGASGDYVYSTSVNSSPGASSCLIDLSQAMAQFSWNGTTYVMDILNLTAAGLDAFLDVRWELDPNTAEWALAGLSPDETPTPGGPVDITNAQAMFDGCSLNWSDVRAGGVSYGLDWRFNESSLGWDLVDVHTLME